MSVLADEGEKLGKIGEMGDVTKLRGKLVGAVRVESVRTRNEKR